MEPDTRRDIPVAEPTIKLSELSSSILEDKAVRRAMAERKPVIYFAPDPDNPRIGYHVQMPSIIQGSYRCGNCPRIVVATFYLPDVINGRVAKIKTCSDCKSKMILRTLGPEKERPVVIREKPKAGLEEFTEGD